MSWQVRHNDPAVATHIQVSHTLNTRRSARQATAAAPTWASDAQHGAAVLVAHCFRHIWLQDTAQTYQCLLQHCYKRQLHYAAMTVQTGVIDVL